MEHPNREGSVLEVEDQTPTQDPNQENPIAQEDGAVGSGCVREDDARLGHHPDLQVPPHGAWCFVRASWRRRNTSPVTRNGPNVNLKNKVNTTVYVAL